MKKFIAVMVSASLLSACATPRGSDTKDILANVPYSGRVKLMPTTGTDKGQRYPDPTLRVVNQSHTAVNTALLVASALLGSIRLPGLKEDSRGTEIETQQHPAYGELLRELAPVVDNRLQSRGFDKQYKNPLYVRPDTYALVYGDAVGETLPYDLYIQTTVFRKSDSAGWFGGVESVTCRDKYSDPKLTLAQWQAEDYALVKARAADHSAGCIKTVQVALDKLLAD